jgi:hypothetical protein
MEALAQGLIDVINGVLWNDVLIALPRRAAAAPEAGVALGVAAR